MQLFAYCLFPLSGLKHLRARTISILVITLSIVPSLVSGIEQVVKKGEEVLSVEVEEP